ncbi:MAG TPA: ATP-binding protein [Acetobacteraceae bacterium]|nr:ATP-binding protein [Acetobacteraceae bacterium]
MMLLAGTGYAAMAYLRASALDNTRRDMTSLGVALAEQTSRTIQSVDLVLVDIQARAAELGLRTPEQFRDAMGGADARRLFASFMRNLPQAEMLSVLDAQGRLLNSLSEASVPSLDLANLDHHRYQRNYDQTEVAIYERQHGSASDRPIMLVVRRIGAPDGTLLGLVIGAINEKYLEDYYRKVSTQPGQSVTLLSSDGVVITGNPEPSHWRGKRLPAGSGWYRQVLQGGGAYDAPDYLGGNAAVVAVRPLSGLPLVINTGTTEQAALAAWHQDSFDVAVARLGVGLVFTALFYAISRSFRQQASHARQLARVAERLRASERQVRDFAEISSDWFWEQDAELRFCWLSSSALMSAGGDHDYMGTTRWELAGSDGTEPLWLQHRADLAQRKPFRDFRYLLRGLDDSVHYISASGVPVFDDAGAFIGYRGTARDVTTEVEAAEELRRSKEAAEAASRAKSEFLANMSHELRTPLNAIIGFSELMQKQRAGRMGDDYAEWAADIMASGRHLLDVINEVLELARIEAGRYVLAQDRVDLGSSVRACVAMVRLQAEAKQLRLECGIADREVVLRADGRAVRQIVLNLLTNAVKFTPDGGAVSVSGGRAANGDAMLVVTDTGIGIDATALASLGEPFTQADASISRNYGGTGLGLSISRKLAAMHGGELTIESRPGMGTTVRVTFPALRVLLAVQQGAVATPPLEATATD